MYKKGTVIPIKGSAALLNNNLTIANAKGLNMFAVICRNYINLTITDSNDNVLNEKQIVVKTSKDGGLATNNSTNDITPNLIQIKFVDISNKVLLIVCTTKGVFFYDSDGTNLLFFFSLNQLKTNTTEQLTYARGIAILQPNLVAIGTSNGIILLFEVPNKSTHISINSQIHEKHFQSGITDLNTNAECDQLCASDTKGNVAVWALSSNNPKLLYILQNESGFACTSVLFHKNYLIAAFGNGIISIFNDGRKFADINAHGRWITSMSIKDNFLISGSEDCYLRIWQLNEINAKFEVRHIQSELVSDSLISAVHFGSANQNKFYVTSYDNTEIITYERK